ncbi:hypothetical protein FT758_00850 [Campylobacter upsaliensis]|nr:hypothetical protein [Campylobacter upsaliensis]
MEFNFNFEAFEQSGKEKNEAINYLKSLNSSIDFDKLEQETKGDENAIYEALKGGNFSFSKPSIEQTRQKLLKNKENEALKAEFNAGLSWLGEEKKQNFNFYDFKKAKEKAKEKQGLTQADLKEKERQMQKKEALFETRLKERGIIAKSFDDMLDQSGAYLGADLLEKGLNKLGFKDENYIFESEKEDIKSRALKSVREKLERGDLEFNEREKHALRSKYDELDYKKALEKEKERLRLSQKSGNFNEAEREFIENDLGFFNTLFNDDKENIKEFKEKVKSEGVISSEIIKAANTLKAFDEGNLFKNMLFADEKEKKEFQQNFLNDAYKIAELSGFDDVGLDKKGELYFIKDEQKYLVNTGFFDNFAQLLNDTKFEFAGGVLGGLKGFNSGKSAKGKVAKSILGAAAGSFGGAFLDAKIADMYLNRESDFKKNLDFAIQAGLLSMAGDGVILSVKPLAKGLYKGVKKGGEILGEYSILGTLKTLPEQNIQAAEKIIDEVFSPKMKEELKAAQEEFGGSVRGEDLKNAFFANLQKKFTQKYGENDSKTKSVAKIAEIFNTNSLKTRQQAMLDLVRSDTHGSTLAYLLEIAKDDVKIQSNLKNMLNLASSNVEKNLKNLNINAREIKHILDEFEAGNKAAFKEVESQIARLYDENYRVVLSKGEYENIKEEFRQNGVNLEEMTPFLRDLEANVFNENGVTFTQLNNFRKNLNFYIFNKDKTPNFINTLKKIGENILKNEIDKGIDNIFSQNKAAYESIKELYSTSLKDYATLKSLNESIKNLKLQDSAKSADEVLNSLIKYAKGQGEKGVNNLQKIKDYLGEENNAFLEMQILNKLFKESVVENDRASLRVFDSESFLSRVRELVGENELYAKNEPLKDFGENFAGYKGKEAIEKLLEEKRGQVANAFYKEGLGEIDLVWGDENFGLRHILNKHKGEFKNLAEQLDEIITKGEVIKRKGRKNAYNIEHNGFKVGINQGFNQKGENKWIVTAFDNKVGASEKTAKTAHANDFTKETHLSLNSNESITQPLFKSKEAREFLELVEGFHKLYKNDASIAKNLVQGTSEKLSTSIATSAEGAIKQKVVKGAFDPIFRLLPDKILFGLFAKQIQGGALRYHLKKALSRSLNYDDFKIKLEKELKRTNFNSNTSRLIDEFMQNLEDFNREKEQFLEAKRIEQTRIKEEERKRAEEIYKRQEEIYQAQEANNLKDILEPSSLKEDFGENFAGYKGKEAIEKLLEEKRGQVKGAFYKEGLGEIDLVWGDENFGLRHIIEQRTKQWGEEKALKFISHLNENIEKGQIVEVQKGRAAIKTDLTTIILDKKENNFVLTAFRDRNNKKELESLNLSQSKTFTSENAEANAKESPVTSLNQESIIAQKAKNDEVLEAEVIEEVGLNEPMKFLEFQQRKLLTYIKENTPLRLLEHKKELKTRDILNFLEQSALNGKQKVFLMRNLERDLGKIELKIKENESVKAKIKNTYEISQSEAKELGEHFNFKGKKPLLRELRENEIKHALKSHGNKESEEARGNIAITLQDIEANYPKITQEFDEKFFTQKGVIYVKQVNGHHIVIEEALSGQDKLIFKTMWKTKGNYNKEVLLKNAKTSPYPQNADEAVRLETISKQELEQSNPQQSHLSTDESIAQNSEKLPFETQTLDEDKLSGDEVRLLANKIGEKSTMAYFKDYLLKMDKNFHARAKDIIREYYKIEPLRKELENQWENVKEAYKNGEMSLKEFKFLSRYKDEKSFLNQVAGVLWLQNDKLVKNRGYTINKYGLTEQGKGDNYYQNLALEYGKAQTALKKWFYYIQKANKQAQRFFNKKELEDLRANEKAQKLEAKGSEDIIFTDKKGKEHTLTKETQKAWLEAFNLKSLEDSYIPNHNEAIKQALEGKEIKLQLGSLKKLVAQGREKYIPQIKEVLDRPEAIMRDDMGEYLFIKHLKDDDYFVNVSFDNGEYLVSISNGIKETRNLNNKLKKGGEFIYQSPNFNFISQKLLQTSQYSANKIDEDIIAQNAKSEKAEFESFKDKMKELYTKYEGLNHYDKSESQLKSELLNGEIKPEIKKEFKSIIDKFKGADNKDKMLRVIKENKEELSDYLAFNIALRKDICIDGQGVGKIEFYDKSIRDFFKLRENKPGSEIYDDSNYIALAALENLSNKNTSLYFSFKDLNGKVGEIKTYPRIQDLLFYDLPLGDDLKNAVILSTKDKHLKEKLIEKLKAYIDKKIYADFLEYKIKDLESRNPKNSYFENYKDEKWDEEALKSFKKELEDLRANEKAQKLEAKGSEDIIFTDKKGKEHTLTKETQKAWLEAFNLKSLDEAYIPNLPRELKEALGKEIKLTKGSLYKIVEKGREKYIPQMKQTLQNPDFALRDRDNMLILAKQIEDKQYFTSVNLETKDYFISVSNAPKKENILKNKVENGAEILYQSPNAKSIFYTDTLLQTDKSSANKIDEDIIAQNAKSESEKEVLERQIPFIEAEIQKYEAKIASLDERIKKTQTRIQPYLDEINALQKQYDELYFTETRGEEANAKKWLKLEEIKAKQEELRKPYNDALFKFVFPYQRLKGKVQTEIQKLKFGLQDRALRLEEIQNEALNTSKAQKAWLEAFNLKSLEEAYIPNFKAEVKEALKSVLNDEEIRLTKGSLIKLIKEKRLKYLDRIKPTLENPHSVILQNDGALIFARDYGEEKYFTSVARNDSGEWIIRSNAPKSKNGLNNKILNGGKEIYNDQAASQINASNPYDDIANSNIKLDNESIAQNADYLELVKEYGEENAKRIIKQKILGENIAQVLENAEEKFIYKKGDREFEFKIKDVMGQFEMQYDELNLKSDLNKSFLKALNKLKIGYEVLENEPVRIRYFKQEAKERKPKETKPSANKSLGQIQKDMSARLKELKAQAKENYERYKNEDKALQKELTNTKDLFKAFEKEFNETKGTILISRAKRRKNDAEGKVETSVFLGNELALRNALDRWERYSGYSEENALEVKERLELLRSYVKRLEKHREDIKAKREQLEQDYQQNEAARSKEMGVIGNYNILSNLKDVSENELYEPFLEKVGGYLSKADFYERHLPFAREEFQKLFNITPLKEFGTNYAEFYRDGKGAVEKLLAEKQGQVSGAFYKEGLGEIDLVWGDSKKGLSHILERRTQDFINQGLEKGKAEYKVRELLSEIPQILENGKILSQNNDKIELITDKYTLVLGLREDKKFIVTELIDKRNKKRLEAMQTGVGDSFTDEPLAKTPLSQNQQEIIPQQKIKFAMEKFHYDEKKAKDLLEWHKNSHALTKDENGLPKVFYHGTYSKFRVFRRVGKASGQGFFFTPSQKATEEYGDITLNAFLNIKNPFRADELKINKEADLQKWADILKLDYDKEKYESFKDLKTKLEKVKEATKKAGFKFHSASGGGVYVIDNKGRNRFINLEELDKENKRVVEAFKGLETEDIYFYYVVRNEFDLVLYALNKNDRYFHTSGRDEVKRVLEKLGYDGVVLNDTIITVFNSNQIKHIDNKGSFTDTKGNVTSKKPKDKEAEFSYFNEKSDNIYHSNPHLGAGLVGGTLNGVEQDENGNLSFDPVKFAMGFLGGSVGSFALKKGFQILEKNPELKEKIINELAHTLAQGFEKAREKYPLLNLLEPRYIVKNEKGRKIQAKTMLKELEREQNKNLQNIIRQNLQNLPLNNKPLELSEKQVKLLINRFANARNLKEHLNTRADNRKELYALLNDTLENPQIHFIKEGRDKYVKRYKGDVNEPYFYLLITQDKDKIFITHLKTRDIKYLSRQISNAEQIKKGADIIEALSQRAGDDKASASKKDYSK